MSIISVFTVDFHELLACHFLGLLGVLIVGVIAHINAMFRFFLRGFGLLTAVEDKSAFSLVQIRNSSADFASQRSVVDFWESRCTGSTYMKLPNSS